MMKRLLILVTAAVVITCIIIGCIGGVKTYTNSGYTIEVGVNQDFIIALDCNPTTGYSWQESFDRNIVELVEKSFETGKEAKAGIVGAGGVERFRFKILRTGETEITLIYKRPWEKPTPQDVTKVFTVNI
ncbi:hypothetical protein ES703_88876 [subsurface metagenome]